LTVYLLVEQWYVIHVLHIKAAFALGAVGRFTATVFLNPHRRGVVRPLSPIDDFISVTGRRGLLVSAMWGLYEWNLLTIGPLITFAFLFGLSDAFFWPARDSILPTIIDAAHLAKANAWLQTSNQLTAILGPFLAGWMLSLLPFSHVFVLTAGMLIISSSLAMGIKSPRSASKKSGRLLSELKEGIAYFRQALDLFVTLIVFAVVNLLFAGPLTVGNPVLVVENLHGKAWELSCLQSSLSVGMLAGALFMGWLPVRCKRLFRKKPTPKKSDG
jgi:MFS family permease